MGEHMVSNGRLIIVSNRLPIVIAKEEEKLISKSGSGGLVTALAPVLKNRRGIWIGWPGQIDEEDKSHMKYLLEKEGRNTGFLLHPIYLNKEEIKTYYEGFSNQVIWPLFHDLQSGCHFDPIYWYGYINANHKFAEGIQEVLKKDDFLWIHDYHLMLLAQEIRKFDPARKMSFFLHIPFPSLDIFVKLPWRFQILRGLLDYDLIGFQTLRDQRNFIQCVRRLLPDVKIKHQAPHLICHTGSREVKVGTFPISIDYQEISKFAAGKEVTNQVWQNYQQLKGQKIIFSCDRLDISKGIPYRLEAIRHLLKNFPELHGKITFFQIVVPSRTEIPEYQSLKHEIDRLVGEINSEYSKTGWAPIQYLYHSINHKELLAYYRISEVALVTPLKDGMNLVAKEYIASNVEDNGVLVLSEFAGAAAQLQREALLINPYDIEGLALTIHKALTMSQGERKKRMRKMRRNVQKFDVFLWVKAFLNAAISKELRDYPVNEEYLPVENG